jgi:pyridoxine kinase
MLSTHTGGFDDYYFLDLTEHMAGMADHWRRLGLDFDAVYSGFLGSADQVEIVRRFIDDFRREEQLVVVDPVLGDDGETYGPFGSEMVAEMRRLVEKADIITPNYTEAALLLGEPYETEATVESLKEWLGRLAEMGPPTVVITSVLLSEKPDISTVVAYDRRDGRFWKVDCDYVPAFYPGTGDLFASVITGALLQGDSLPIAIERAVQFVSISIRSTFGHSEPNRDGVHFERVLGSLTAPLTSSGYEILR